MAAESGSAASGSGKTLVVTGGAGFVGWFCVLEALARGYRTVALIREEERPKAPIEGAEYLVPDWSDAEATEALLAGLSPAGIVHAAGRSVRAADEVAFSDLYEANVALVWALLGAVASAGLESRVVLLSTAAVYGMDPETPTPETAPLEPVSHYGESKVLAERLASSFSRISHVDVCSARLFNVIGPGEPKGSVTRAIVDQLLEAPEGGMARVRLLEERSSRDFVDVRDVASALVTLAERGSTGEAYNVCTGEGTSIRKLFDVAVRASGRSATLEVTKPELPPSVSLGDSAKLRALGWAPRYAIEQSIADEMGEL